MAKEFAKAFYHSKDWRNTRRSVLRRDNYTCVSCYDRASEVHHIIPLTPQNINDCNISLNPSNLLSYCWACHNKITQGAGDLSEEYIFDEDGQVVRLHNCM